MVGMLLMAVGGIVMLVFGIMVLIKAFQTSILWGLRDPDLRHQELG